MDIIAVPSVPLTLHAIWPLLTTWLTEQSVCLLFSGALLWRVFAAERHPLLGPGFPPASFFLTPPLE